MGKPIAIAAGGTGGHLFPGIAVADELRLRDFSRRIVFVGTPKGLESRLVPQAGYELSLLPILPLKRVGGKAAIRGLLALPRALLQSFFLLSRLRPGAVLGIGGYAGGPFCLAAALRGVPTVILEPNAKPGFTNRALRPFATLAACAYPSTLSYFPGKAVLTGNPVRSGFGTLRAKDHTPPLTLLAFGGSQGSRALNRALVSSLSHLPKENSLKVVHQTGEAMLQEVQEAYKRAGRKAEVLAFMDDMLDRFQQADLVLCRSGATTCAELTAAGKAAILIPFKGAADDHQRANARALVEGGAARMLEEQDLGGESLGRAISDLVARPEAIQEMEAKSRRLGRPEAGSKVADLLESLCA